MDNLIYLEKYVIILHLMYEQSKPRINLCNWLYGRRAREGERGGEGDIVKRVGIGKCISLVRVYRNGTTKFTSCTWQPSSTIDGRFGLPRVTLSPAKIAR